VEPPARHRRAAPALQPNGTFGASAVSPYTRAALFLIRLIAAGFVICSLCCVPVICFMVVAPSAATPRLVGAKGRALVDRPGDFLKSEDIAKQLTKDLD